MKYQVLFSQKHNDKIFKNVVCCSHDWPLRVNDIQKSKSLYFSLFLPTKLESTL